VSQRHEFARRGRGIAVVALGLAAAGLLPARAAAHAGRIAPAATSFLARVSSAPAGIDARVVDGDQRLWLRVSPQLTVLVLGLRGEPYLRFSSRGIEVNTRSATYYLNRARPLVPPAGLGPNTSPHWKRISSGRSTSWHDDRLHALALAAHPSGNATLGRWVVPVVVDGQRTAVAGTLRHAARPSLLWFWPLLLAAALVPALLRLREARLEVPVGWALAALALAAATAARLGRELYGRPTVSAGQLALAGVTCAVALGLAVLCTRREWRVLAEVAIGALALYQGIALWATLRNGYVLAALPSSAERTAAALSLAAGAALLVAVLAAGILGETKEQVPTRAGRRAAG
jgi:hypothetical protein